MGWLRIVPLIAAWAPFAAAQCTFSASGSGRTLIYRFAADPPVLHATLEFPGGAKGRETVEVPAEWAGEKLHNILNLHAVSKGATLSDTDTPGEKILRYPPNQHVILAYDLVQDWSGPLNHPLQFHGVLQPQYFEINGENALVYPGMDPQTPVSVFFDWSKLPSDWALATSFGASSGSRDRCQSYTGEWRSVTEAVFAAGDFRLHDFQIGPRPAVLAIRGKWTFTDDDVIAELQKTIGMEREFWHDDNFPYFLVTWKPFDVDHGSGDGSAFTNAFWIYMSRLDALSSQVGQIAHENFHEWNPGRMGALPESSSQVAWFTEGFTRYYADDLLNRARMLRLHVYLDGLNRDLVLFPRSTDPYGRGRVIAFWLNEQIRRNTKNRSSLDNVMFDLVRDNDRRLTQKRVLATIDRYLSRPARRQLEQAVQNGGVLQMPPDAFGACAQLSMDKLVLFDLGFDFPVSMKAHRVTGVRPDGPAFRAGLRDGQALQGWSVYNDQPDKEARLDIRVDGAKKSIRYYPRGETVTMPQYHVRQDARCSIP